MGPVREENGAFLPVLFPSFLGVCVLRIRRGGWVRGPARSEKRILFLSSFFPLFSASYQPNKTPTHKHQTTTKKQHPPTYTAPPLGGRGGDLPRRRQRPRLLRAHRPAPPGGGPLLRTDRRGQARGLRCVGVAEKRRKGPMRRVSFISFLFLGSTARDQPIPTTTKTPNTQTNKPFKRTPQ